MLALTERGVDDIISKNSDIYKELHINFDNITISETLSLINEHRSLIRRPIIIDETHLQIGFNDDEIRQFIPRKHRNLHKEMLTQNLYKNYLGFND